MAYVKTTSLWIVAVSMIGCGWESKVKFPSTSTGSVIEIQQPFPANGWGMRLQVKRKVSTKTLYQIKGDVFLTFADAVWADNDRIFAIVTCGTPQLRLAYMSDDYHEIPFHKMEPIIAAHIRSRYHLEALINSREVLDWACSDKGARVFQETYPNAIPR